MHKILIVDDVSANRLLLKKMLMLMGIYNIVEASNGKEGLERFQAENPDLVLMDVNMPVLDGYQATAAIKALPREHHTPIIFITALSAEASLKNSLVAGGDDFISKPFDADVLESKIKAHLRIRELTRQLVDKNELLITHNQRLVNEQELLEHFFTNTIKQSFLEPGVIKYHMSSLSTFNGDILFVKNGPEGGIYVVMGDFSGHGLTAAMGTLPVAMIFFRMVSEGAPISNIARELNNELYKLMPSSMFFAATLLELNAKGDIMSVWMGGAPETYCFSGNGELKETIHARHMPLGILKDTEFDSTTQIVSVDSGDKIYLYSDGVIEAKNSEGVIFGDDRLRESLTSTNENRFEQVLDDLRLFTGRKEQEDDITLVELTCKAVPAENPDEIATAPAASVLTEILPWKISVLLTEKEMSKVDVVNKLSATLTCLPGLERHKDILHVILSEMYTNALEHSILNLQSESKDNEEHFENFYKKRSELLKDLKDASIYFEFIFNPPPDGASLHMRMTDSGRGFHRIQSSSSDELLYGRGLIIIKSFCEEVSFSEDGKTLDVIYRL